MDRETATVYVALAVAVVLLALTALTAYLYHANEVTERVTGLNGAAQADYVDFLANGQ